MIDAMVVLRGVATFRSRMKRFVRVWSTVKSATDTNTWAGTGRPCGRRSPKDVTALSSWPLNIITVGARYDTIRYD